MAGISIEIMEDDIEEVINALRWWGGEKMENLAKRLPTPAMKKIEEGE